MAKHCSSDFIKEKLENYDRYKMAATKRVAAVLVPIISSGDECSIIFTKRIRDLNHHGGEVSFPGGICEDADNSLAETAVRETHEEIGVEPEQIKVLGMMDDELSKWGHRVTPVVGLISKPEFKLQETEVDRLYKIPVSYLLRDDIYYSEKWLRRKEWRDVHFYKYDNDIIWGLTAKIAKKFLDYMRS